MPRDEAEERVRREKKIPRGRGEPTQISGSCRGKKNCDKHFPDGIIQWQNLGDLSPPNIERLAWF